MYMRLAMHLASLVVQATCGLDLDLGPALGGAKHDGQRPWELYNRIEDGGLLYENATKKARK
jgi:hypothetical protein